MANQFIHNLSFLDKSTFAALPSFRISSSQVQILHEPKEFYDTLLQLSSTCQRRIIISTLYLGTGELEKRLCETWLKTLRHHIASQTNDFHMKFLLSFTRGSRPSPEKESSRTMLLPLLQEGSHESVKNRVNVSLYCDPHLRNVSSFLPTRYNELFGLQHMKIYLIDDTLIFGGVNLSQDYFTNRQDRCYVIHGVKSLGDYCEDLVDTVSSLSYGLQSDDSVLSNCPIDPRTGNLKQYLSHGKETMQNFIARHQPTSIPSNRMDDEWDTIIHPSLQLRVFGVEQEHKTYLQFLRYLNENLSLTSLRFHLFVATGYFNPVFEYQQAWLNLIKSEKPSNFPGELLAVMSSLSMLTSSPEANGFLNSSGLSKYIPSFYLDCTHRFIDSAVSSKIQGACRVFEYYRPNWTFHAKGTWLSYFSDRNHSNSLGERTVLTEIGSTNYGYRSVYKDLELQLYISTRNDGLQCRMARERQYLFGYSQQIHKDGSVSNTRNPLTPNSVYRRIPLWLHYLVPLLKKIA